MNIGEAVKERILELCRERDITINKLSNMSGVTQSTVNNIVSGRNNSTTISTIKKLCDGLGITIEEFFHSELFRGLEQEIKRNIWKTPHCHLNGSEEFIAWFTCYFSSSASSSSSSISMISYSGSSNVSSS